MISKEMVGRTVVIYEPYGRTEKMIADATQGCIDKVGRKYAEVGRWKFDRETLAEWSLNKRLFLGTLEEFKESLHLMKDIRCLMEHIQTQGGLQMPLDKMKDIECKLKKMVEVLKDAGQ